MKPGHMLVFIDLDYAGTSPPQSELVPCTRDMIVQGLAHQKFYVIVRALRNTFGPWPVVMINGEECVIDGSVPTHLNRIPRDAVEITGELMELILHNKDGHHAWACCYVSEVTALLESPRASRR
jgi:hypothetical protein